MEINNEQEKRANIYCRTKNKDSLRNVKRRDDYIVIQRFFRTLKHGNIYINDYQTIRDLKEGVKAYIYKYNFKRFHSSLDYKKPMNVYLEYLKSVG